MDTRSLLRRAPVALLLTSSLVLNVALLARVTVQRERIVALTPKPALKVGAQMGPVTGADGSGTAIVVDTALSAATLLYVFTPECGWCQRNAANIKHVVAAARRRGMNVYALSLVQKDAARFLSDDGLDIPWMVPSAATKTAYSLGGTPETIILSGDGRIVKAWRGAYVGSRTTQ